MTPDCESSELLEKALCILQDGIFIVDRNATIVYINRIAQEVLQKQWDYLPKPGDNYISLVQQERRGIAQAFLDDALENKTGFYELYYPHDGREVWFEMGYHPIPDEHRVVNHVCIKAKDITEKVILERQLARQRESQKNSIIKATLMAQERERNEIGRELHDNVNQVLTTVKLYNEICLTEDKTNKNLLLKSIQQINYCIETLRGLSRILASPSVTELGLKETIKELVDSINATRRLEVRFYSYGIKEDQISQEIQTTIYRIAQEQITNIIKYAHASVVDLLLVGTANTIALRIQDNGQGFDFDLKRRGVGITNMISRTESLGGTIEFDTSPGNGCSLMVELPIG